MDDDQISDVKQHARAKYRHGRLPLFSNKTRGGPGIMMTVAHESRVCDAKGMWPPSHTSQTWHQYTRAKSNSVSSDDSTGSGGGGGGEDMRLHYQKPHQRKESKKTMLKASKELSHHRERNQRREDLASSM